jgi:hypothetical protein
MAPQSINRHFLGGIGVESDNTYYVNLCVIGWLIPLRGLSAECPPGHNSNWTRFHRRLVRVCSTLPELNLQPYASCDLFLFEFAENFFECRDDFVFAGVAFVELQPQVEGFRRRLEREHERLRTASFRLFGVGILA